MLDNYLIIHKSILPEYYEKVLEARHLLEEGKAKDVSQAVKEVGISRSTYYKYKDYILEPTDLSGCRNAVLALMLSHEPGVLSTILKKLSDVGGSILAINQSLPIHGKANVTISLDVSNVQANVTDIVRELGQLPGVEQAKLLAIE